MSAQDPFDLIAVDEKTTPMLLQPLALEAVVDETIQLLCEKLVEQEQERDRLDHDVKLNAAMLARQCDLARQAEIERDLAQGAMRAQDENLRRQLLALGLADRFMSLTHLADEMGEALLKAERA